MLMKYSLFTIWSILVNLKNVPVGSAAISVPIRLILAAESPEDTVVMLDTTAACCSAWTSLS